MLTDEEGPAPVDADRATTLDAVTVFLAALGYGLKDVSQVVMVPGRVIVNHRNPTGVWGPTFTVVTEHRLPV